MTFYSTKTYDHNSGFSCAFRQWRAESHCRLLHGYALAFKFKFRCEDLDYRQWCIDFGGLKGLKSILEENFDHTTLVAEDDPELAWFKEAESRKLLKLIVLPSVGCERTAQFVYEVTEQWLKDAGFSPRCSLVSVEVSEHSGNSAVFSKDPTYSPLPFGCGGADYWDNT